LILSNPGTILPAALLEQVALVDPNASVKRSWASVTDTLMKRSCRYPDVIIDVVTDPAPVMKRIRDLWQLRVRHNYSSRPAYFAISRNIPPPLVRFDIERLGGHYLLEFDVPAHFQQELAQIRLGFGPLTRSLPCWWIVQEGNGTTLRAVIYLVTRKRRIRVGGSDRHAAVLAAFIKHNGISRSIGAWQKILSEDLLFKPAGGSFDVPSRSSLKAYLHRDLPRYLQQAFDQERTGYCADRVIECMNPGTWATEYRIRGEWEVVRR
jgi:hypothetical protein